MAANSKTSPWVWVATGCGCALLLIAGCFVGVGYLGFRQAKEIEEMMSDPEKRREAALDVLNAEELPPGYHPMMGFSVPFVMDTAILTDGEIVDDFDQESPDLGDRGFIYIKMLRFDTEDQRELQDYFEGKTDDPRVLRRSNINVDLRPRDRIANGELPTGEGQLFWVSHRADSLSHHGDREALATMMSIQCPDDERLRFGIFYGPDPTPEVAIAEADWTGTAADPAEIEAFTSYFDFCAP